MKIHRIYIIFIVLTILISYYSRVNATTNESIVKNVIQDYLESYKKEFTEPNLKLKSYNITDIQILEQTNNEIIASFSATIEPEIENHGWSTTDLFYYLKIQKINEKWEITQKSTSPISIADTTLYSGNNSKSIVYSLINEYFENYQQDDIADNLKLRNYDIKNVDIISESDFEIIAKYEAEIIPYSENHSWSTTNLFYYLKIQKINEKWEIVKQSTSPINTEETTSSTNLVTYNVSQTELNTNKNNFSIQYACIIALCIIILIIAIYIIKITLYKKHKF